MQGRKLQRCSSKRTDESEMQEEDSNGGRWQKSKDDEAANWKVTEHMRLPFSF